MRRAARRDSNERGIILALERLGFSVEQLSAEGMPDLLLSRGRRWYVAEVKSARGVLTRAQSEMRARHGALIPVFRSGDDAIEWANREVLRCETT